MGLFDKSKEELERENRQLREQVRSCEDPSTSLRFAQDDA